MTRRSHFAISVALLAASSSTALAGIVVEEFDDKDAWIDAVGGNFTTIDFTGFPIGTFITDQYEDLGVIFTDGNDFAEGPDEIIYPNDGWGLSGFGPTITVEFDQPMQWIAADFPGDLLFQLFNNDTLIYESSEFGGAGGPGNFGGLVSSVPFNRAVIDDGFGGGNIVFMDDLHFGPPIPAPGALPLLGLALLAHQRRRRR